MRYLFFFFVILIGCRIGPRYEPPSSLTPEQWKGEHAEASSSPFITYWWEIFADDNLNALEKMAVENNPNLFAALQKVISARAEAGVKEADLYPQLNLAPSYSNTGTLFKIFLPSGITLPGPPIKTTFRVHQLQYTLPLNMSYELDLWGKLSGRYESAFFNAQAQEEAFYTVLLTLTTDLASAYFQLRSYDTQLDILEKTIETRKNNYQLNKNRYEKGLSNYLDVTQAETDLANSSATYEDTKRLRGLQENKIATLIGIPSSLFAIEYHPLVDVPPVIPAGVPSDVIKQRPDIAQAERTMASEHALIGVAYANFFPSLTLTGALGYSSPDFRQFLKWISRLWMIGANVNENIFDGGRNCSNLAEAWANFREASGDYQQVVLTAFQEVEDALENLEQQYKQSLQLKIAVDSSTQSTEISRKRYYQGITTYLEVVENEKTELQAQLTLANLLGVQYLSTIQLIKALGGSWSIQEDTDCSDNSEIIDDSE
jgi:outer membrane protein, multidrug efflux system